MYYAHSKLGEPKENWQTLKEHLTNTAELSGSFAQKFNAGEIGYTVGLLHDIGKYSTEFQHRLNGCSKPVDHATPGLKQVFAYYKKSLATIMGYVICGHHSGLPNYGNLNQEGSLEYRKEKELKENYFAFLNDISIPELANEKIPLKPSEEVFFSCYFFIKMLYSCLVDADFLDTEKFMDESKSKNRNEENSLENLMLLLNKKLEEVKSSTSDSKINYYRQIILQNCIENAKDNPGMFSLTVPTGGGKTLSSMAFALNHAIKNGLERVIYVIPYTSIIEQNAKVFRDIFGEENILEHHSNFQFDADNEDYSDIKQKLKLASENWNFPIVVTTNVQFFESLFSNRSSRCRKLHNLAKSVIVLDEAQMLPVNYLKACILALCELTRNYGSSVVLCTATQPNLGTEQLMPRHIEIKEIVQEPKELYKQLRRTRIVNLGDISDVELLKKLVSHNQVLCIVNRREHARVLYEGLQQTEHTFHLSTKMYPKHRQKVLTEIRKRLRDGLPCQVISTQLIEAGVDVDFPVVYRAIAGIDSIAQAAGRCNREGKQSCSDVFVFTPVEKHGQPPKELELNVSEAKSVFRNVSDPLSIEGIGKYFELLYSVKNIDGKNIVKDIKEMAKSLSYPFKDIASKFKLIEETTIPLIVIEKDNQECELLIDKLKYSSSKYGIVRKLQPYIVNVYPWEFNELERRGGVAPVDHDKMYYILTETDIFYDKHTGIKCDSDKLLKNLLMV